MNTAVIFEAFAAEKHPSRIWFYEAVVGVSAAKRELPVCCVQQDETIVAPSFDAAWGNEAMQTLIEILEIIVTHKIKNNNARETQFEFPEQLLCAIKDSLTHFLPYCFSHYSVDLLHDEV